MPKKTKAEPLPPAENATPAEVREATGERFYPPFSSAAAEDATLVKHAEKWAKAYSDKTPAKMDAATKGLTLLQTNRVIIMGQRIVAGQPPIPKEKKDKPNAKEET